MQNHKLYTSVIIGTGFSGLAMAIALKKRGVTNFIILEKAVDVGGTWRENTYPGAECDIPSALYSYSFEPYPYWEYKWSMQPQILEYIKYVVDKHELRSFIQFNTEVIGASWNESEKTWLITTKNGESIRSKTFISAIGQLHYPSSPQFEGIEKFKGDQFHSAQWNHEVSLKNKVVGVVGNAASAVQFIPEIAKDAKVVKVFQRSANWMLPKQDRAYKSWEKKLVKNFPSLLKLYRVRLWLLGGGLFFLMKNGNNALRKIYQGKTLKFIKKHIQDPEKIKALTPEYPMGAKRILFSDTYYPALAQEHVQLETSGIKCIYESGIETTNDEKHDLDTIIFATGFKTNPFLFKLEITGRNKLNLHEHWKEGPKNYLGVTTDQFPNLFIMYGPNTNLGHNSIIIMSEAQAKYIAQCVVGIASGDYSSMEVKKEIIDNYYSTTQARLQNMIWGSIEKSWYKSANGHIPNNYPGRTMEYMRVMRKLRISDYELH